MYSWRDEMGRMWRFSKTNSIAEGLRNKMEILAAELLGLEILAITDSRAFTKSR